MTALATGADGQGWGMPQAEARPLRGRGGFARRPITRIPKASEAEQHHRPGGGLRNSRSGCERDIAINVIDL
jgi:hypothetical protein